MSGRPRPQFRCDACGAVAARWRGRCGTCGEWNTVVESDPARRAAAGRGSGPVPIDGGPAGVGTQRIATGCRELDRVLGGGLVPGGVVLVGGAPGIGKSTLLLQVAASISRSGAPVLYVSSEESVGQVQARADRIRAQSPDLWVSDAIDLVSIGSELDELAPRLCVVDSIQTVVDPETEGGPGSIQQVRACTRRLIDEARVREIAVALVGHVTKDGGLAGPRVLEHAVDTVLSFEGDRHHALRLVRALKHRHGPTGELGVLEMTPLGLIEVADASAVFLADRREGVPGSVVVATLVGDRPLLVEVQALVVPTAMVQPRRSAEGLDSGRTAVLLAVLAQRAGVKTDKHEVYAMVAGGMQVSEPGADLGVCLAIASAQQDRPLPPGLVACGEVGLGGELRQPLGLPQRMAEAVRLGFRSAVVPRSAPDIDGMELFRCPTLAAAIEIAFESPSFNAPGPSAAALPPFATRQ